MNIEKTLSLSQHRDYAKKIIARYSASSPTTAAKKVQWQDMSEAPKVDGNHFSRDLQNLIWRYEQHPFYVYKTYEIPSSSNDDESAFVVFREEINEKAKIPAINKKKRKSVEV